MNRSLQLALALALACACTWAPACGASDPGDPVGGGDVSAAVDDASSSTSGGGDVADDDASGSAGDGLPDPDAAGGDAGPSDAGWAADLEYVHDIAGWLDLGYLFDTSDDEPDTDGPLPDGGTADGLDATGGGGGAAGDVAPEPDVWDPLVDVVPSDDSTVAEDDAVADAADDEDGVLGYDTFFDECEELGIPSEWAGTFSGDIAFDIDSGGLVSPEQGLLAVAGELTFSIECIESKLVVEGQLSGSANIEGQGDFPYNFNMLGFYNPTTGELNADLTDGVAVVYDLVEIYFLGTFDGQLTEDDSFVGTWTGEAQGTNLAFITGIAEGDGEWMAAAVPSE